MKLSPITLGTAQMGSNYGIANTLGKPDIPTANLILKTAIKAGINTFDTAPDYGNSEEIIGKFLSENNISTANIITKIPKITASQNFTFIEFYNSIKMQVLNSMKKLNVKQIPICLLHSAGDMKKFDGVISKCLFKIKNEGLIKKIGVSVYEPSEIKEFLDIGVFDVIQLPINIFDLRLIKNQFLNELIENNVIVFARSIFLQGLLFLEPNKLPLHLSLASKYLKTLNEISNNLGISIAELAVTFVRDLPGIDSLVLGVESVDQLNHNRRLIQSPPMDDKTKEIILNEFSMIPDNLINPALWKINR